MALRFCHAGSADEADQALATNAHTCRHHLRHDAVDAVSRDRVGNDGFSIAPTSYRILCILCEVAEPLIAAFARGAPTRQAVLAMELRHTGRGVAHPPPGHGGLGYWDSPFLFMGCQ